MPKRPNPFGDMSPMQLKSHITTKEVNMGVQKDQNMQVVYEKTKSLLFEGSKKALNSCSSSVTPQDWGFLPREQPSTSAAQSGQMQIDPSGQLLFGSAPVPQPPPPAEPHYMDMDMDAMGNNNNCGMENMNLVPQKGQLRIDPSGGLCATTQASTSFTQKPTLEFRICHSCNRPSNVGARKCAFCEKTTCTNCLRQCCRCRGIFCQFCSVLIYEDCLDKSVCLQCST